MDEKLTRGYARELFRNLKKYADVEKGTRASVIAATLSVYIEHGGVKEEGVFDFAKKVEEGLKSEGEMTAALDCIKHPVRRRAILRTTYPARVDGTEQAWLVAPSNTFVFEKKRLQIIETVHHAAISEHAVFRIFERNGQAGADIIAQALDKVTLWTYPLLHALAGSDSRKPAEPGTSVAMPFMNGLFLGTLEINDLENEEQGPTLTTCKRGDSKLERLIAPFSPDRDSILTLSINTFVGKWELFDNQKHIVDELNAFEARFTGSMNKFRQSVALGFPDPAVTALVKIPEFTDEETTNLFALADHVRDLFETREWQQHAKSFRPRVRTLQ